MPVKKSKSSIKPYLRNKKSSMQEMRERNLKKWKDERLEKIQSKQIIELDEFCHNCKKHLNEDVKIVKYEGFHQDEISSCCPVCHRAALRDEYLYSESYQEFMKNLEKKIKNGNISDMVNPRFDIMDILGGRICKRCGFDDVRGLQIDHIKGDGAKDRKKFKNVQYMWHYYNNNPKEARKNLQVLCANCNWIKRVEEKETSWHTKRKDGELTVQKKVKEYKRGLKNW